MLPIDPRLPAPARRRLLEALRPRCSCPPPASAPGWTASRSRRATRSSSPPRGTTGEPRGVVLTHDAVAASAKATSARLGVDPGRGPLVLLPPARPRRRPVGGDACTRHGHTARGACRLRGRRGARRGTRRGATLVSLVPTTLRRIGPGRGGLPHDRPRRVGAAGGAAAERGHHLRDDRDRQRRRLRRRAARRRRGAHRRRSRRDRAARADAAALPTATAARRSVPAAGCAPATPGGSGPTAGSRSSAACAS